MRTDERFWQVRRIRKGSYEFKSGRETDSGKGKCVSRRGVSCRDIIMMGEVGWGAEAILVARAGTVL